MIYSYWKINFIGGIFFLGQTYLKPINGRIDNKMAVFFFESMSPKVESLRQTEKNLGATGDEIFRFSWRNWL